MALRTGLVVLAVLAFLPLFTHAQETAPASSIYCPALSQTLLFGMRDSQTIPRGQVTELQKFLSDYYDLNPDTYVTGYFGRLTRDSVRRFQCERMNICSGTEATTGWGVVGPKTRGAIRNACGTATTPYAPAESTAPARPRGQLRSPTTPASPPTTPHPSRKDSSANHKPEPASTAPSLAPTSTKSSVK